MKKTNTTNVIAKAIKEEANETAQKQQPEAKFRSGALSATVWKNETKLENNEIATNYSFTIDRAYTKDDGKTFEHTNSFRKRDVASVQALLNKVSEYLLIDEDEEKDSE